MQVGRITIYFIKNKTFIDSHVICHTLAMQKITPNKQNEQVKIKTWGIRCMMYDTRMRIFFLRRKQVLIKAE
ncbi:hypothetical protein [Apibacter adventoris]|uniref:Uncharacterized protein n=1 Tax=Apibacter adventoris TaxID=1679466 RepID=A0A2S8AF22_9FLAO|nr:hypothetical protein [Apibacter adventoris]PQL94133.1 hypothetical protein C4S77_04050 [Apibacter adventoris]